MRQTQHFFIDADLNKDRLSVVDPALLHQMKDVLRFRAGDPCVLLDGRGLRAEAVLESFHKKEAVFLLQKKEHCALPKRPLRLFVAVSKKPATLEWIVEKATELGVTDIFPVDTERCQVHELRKTERLQAIIKEAAEQCERCTLPTLHSLQTLSEVLASLPEGDFWAGDPWTYDAKLSTFPRSETAPLSLLIGPEGGLSPQELEAVRAAGGRLFQLGELVLRMETAVIAALSVVQFS